MIFVAILFLAGLFFVAKSPARESGYYASVSALVLAVLVPSNTPPTNVVALANLAALLLLTAGAVRSLRFIQLQRINLWLILFIVYVTLRSLLETDWPYGLVLLTSGASLGLLAALASQDWRNRSGDRRDLLLLTVPALVFVQFLLALGEITFQAKAIWPMSVGWDNIESRVNTIAPWLVGRALGSTGHPIPLGVLAACALVISVWLLVERRAYWSLAIAAGATAAAILVFAGTRSAAIAAGLAIAYLFASKAKLRTVLVGAGVAVAAAAIAYFSGMLGSIGLDGVKSTDSFVHRAGVLQLLPEIAQRDSLVETLFGTGYNSIAEALRHFSVGVDGIDVFDQEFLRTGWATGLLGLGLLLAAVVVGWRRNDTIGRMLVIIMMVMFASWDALSWNLGFVLFIFAAARRRQPQGDVLPGDQTGSQRGRHRRRARSDSRADPNPAVLEARAAVGGTSPAAVSAFQDASAPWEDVPSPLSQPVQPASKV